MADLHDLTAAELASALAAGETSSVELTRAHLDRIEALDGRLSIDTSAAGPVLQAEVPLTGRGRVRTG